MKLPSAKDYHGTEWIVLDESYTVSVAEKIPGENSKTLGICDSAEQAIWIKKRQSKAQAFRTMLHEILGHALDDEYEIGLTHDQVYKLEKALGDFFLTNSGQIMELFVEKP